MQFNKDFYDRLNLQVKCLLKLDKKAHEKFGDTVHSVQVHRCREDKFTGLVKTKDGKTHRMTIKL